MAIARSLSLRLSHALSRAPARLRPTARRDAAAHPVRALPPDGPHCIICSAQKVERRHLVYMQDEKLTKDVTVCRACGHVAIDEIVADRYRGKTSLDQLPSVGSRIGTPQAPGREFHMAQLGMSIRGGRRPHDVLVYGAGRSMDNHHIAALDSARHVAIGDIMKARDDMEFHDANQAATRTFDIVVASEVIEHFRDPINDFPKLLQFVGQDGVLVCGTTLRGVKPLVKNRYLFYPDHTSLYTPRSLQLIARANGVQVDVRPVHGAPVKRYVIFTKSPRMMERVVAHFGNHPFGPSERPTD